MSSTETGEGVESEAATAPETPKTVSEAVEQDAPAEATEPEADPRDERIAKLELELASTKEQLLRAVAEVQNIAKRGERDRRDAETYGGAKLARDLLSVYDNLEAAVKLAPEELRESAPAFFNGVELTRKELLQAFGKHKISPVAPELGEKFDPNRHEAMFEAPTPGAEPGSIIQVIQSGFTLSDRLLRPAMVGVARVAPEADDASETSSDD